MPVFNTPTPTSILKPFTAVDGFDSNFAKTLNLADPTLDKDAVTLGFVQDAGNVATGTLPEARLPQFTGGTVVSSTSGTSSLHLTDTGVLAGTYKFVSVNSDGRITSGSNPTTIAGFGITNAYTKTEVDLAIAGATPTLDADLTAIAALSGTTGFLKKTAANTWALDTTTFATDSLVVHLAGTETISGVKTFSNNTIFSNTVGIGGSPTGGTQLQISRPITGAVLAYGIEVASTVASDVTSGARVVRTNIATASGFSLPEITHFFAQQGSFSGSVTSQYGFLASSSLIGATNNYGFAGNIPAGTGRYNFFGSSTADNLFNGNVILGGSATFQGNGSTITSLNATNISSGTLNAARLPAFTGDATSTAGTSALTLATVATAGTYKSVTINAKGLVTSGTNPTTLAGYGITDAATDTLVVHLAGTETITGVKTFTSGVTVNAATGTALILDGAASNIELGRQDGTANAPHIDFHAGTTLVDYDARITASAGTGVIGGGTLTLSSSTLIIDGSVGIGSIALTDRKVAIFSTASSTSASEFGLGVTTTAVQTSGTTNKAAILAQGYTGTGFAGTGAVVGVLGQGIHNTTGTVADLRGLSGFISNASTGTITQASALFASNASNASGSIGTYNGLFIPDINAGTNNIGVNLNVSSGANKYNIYAAGTADNYFAGNISTGGNLIVTGDLTVNGTTTTINAATLTVDDKNIELGSVTTPTNTTADGGGITLKGATDKTIIWDNANANWTSSENWNLVTGKTFKINNTDVLNATTLGSTVVSSSLTSVGILSSLSVSGNVGIGIVPVASSGKLQVSNTTAGAIDWAAHFINTSGTASSAVGISLDPGANGVNIRDAQIRAINNGANQIDLIFYTANAAAPVERMRIDYAGVISGNGSGLTTLNASNVSSGTLAVGRLPALTGDVTSAVGTGVLTITAIDGGNF